MFTGMPILSKLPKHHAKTLILLKQASFFSTSTLWIFCSHMVGVLGVYPCGLQSIFLNFGEVGFYFPYLGGLPSMGGG